MPIDSILWAAASVFLLVRLLKERLWGKYPFMLAFLAASAAVSIILEWRPALHVVATVLLFGLQATAALAVYARTATTLVNFTRGSVVVAAAALVIAIAGTALLRLAGVAANEAALAIFMSLTGGFFALLELFIRAVKFRRNLVLWYVGLVAYSWLQVFGTHNAPIAILIFWGFSINKAGEVEVPLPPDSDYDVMIADLFADFVKRLFR